MGFDDVVKPQSVQLIFTEVVCVLGFFFPAPELTYNLLDISLLIISSEVVPLHRRETDRN